MTGLFMLLLVLVFQPTPPSPGAAMPNTPTITLPPGVDLPGRLAFASFGNIYVHDFQTQQTHKFSTDHSMWHPRWSPNGQSIVYGDNNVGLLDVSTGRTTLLHVPQNLREGIGSPRWHPDGQRIIYTERGVGTIERNLVTGQWQVLLPPGIGGVAWAPDGHTLLAQADVPSANSSTRFDPVHLFTLDVRTCRDVAGRYDPELCAANAVQLTHEGHVNGSPAFNHDGTRLVFSRQMREGDLDDHVVIRDMRTGEERVLVSGRRFFLSFNWGPDERWIIAQGRT